MLCGCGFVCLRLGVSVWVCPCVSVSVCASVSQFWNIDSLKDRQEDGVQNGREDCHLMQPTWSTNKVPGVEGAPVERIQPPIPLAGHALGRGRNDDWLSSAGGSV